METIQLKGNKIKHVSLDELKKYYAKSNKTEWALNPSKYYHSFGKDWYSTSQKTPMLGGIFKDVTDGAVITFKTKYKETLFGIVSSISYDKQNDKVYLSVQSSNCGFGEDPINYGISFTDKTIKVLEGKLPDFKAELASLKSVLI